jgi:5-methylcytosine-specific restriction endonuclease McrA
MNRETKERRKKYNFYLNSDAWRAKRKEAIAFYRNSCSECGSGSTLHVHHKTYVNFGHEPMSDLSLLCEDCHMILHGHVAKVKSKLKKKEARRRRRWARLEKREKAIKVRWGSETSYRPPDYQ